MRTDTERLEFIFAAMAEPEGERAERMQAAYTLELRGRPMVDAAMGAKLVEPGEPMPELTALDLAVAEVGRIRNVKGFSEERDDGYRYEELALASALYTLPDGVREEVGRELKSTNFAFAGYVESHLNPDDRKKELTKGIALALCELDRLIRAERRVSLEMQAQVCAEMNEAACEPEVSPREFKVGDGVRVVRSSLWDGWAPEMNAYIGDGATYEVTEISKGTARVDGWFFPFESLEHVVDLVSGADRCVVDGVLQPQPREFKVGDRVRVVSADTIWEGWVSPQMDTYVGKGAHYEITNVSARHAQIDDWFFPNECLEHVDG